MSPSLGCREKNAPPTSPELGHDLQSVAPTPARAAEKKNICTYTPFERPPKKLFVSVELINHSEQMMFS